MIAIDGIDIDPRHVIGGVHSDGAQRFDVVSPIDGRLLAQLPSGTPDDVDRAVAAARAAFPGWAAFGVAGRVALLRRLAALIEARVDDFARLETLDNGSLTTVNRGWMIPRAAGNFSYYADFIEKLVPPVVDGAVHNEVSYDPAGVAAIVMPWNAPLVLITWKLAPALAVGDTAVIKPPEWAPLSAALLMELVAEAGFPPGVVNLVHGPGEPTGAALVGHPGVDRVAFTGSTATARKIGVAAAQNLTPVSFELGGKSPVIVTDAADLDLAHDLALRQYYHAGQICFAGTRLLLQENIADAFIERLAAAVGAQVVGDPRDPATQIGPLIAPRQFARVERMVSTAVGEGSRVFAGGGAHDFGPLYYRPTLMSAEPDQAIWREEVFGPVLVTRTFADDAAAVALANASDYGLAGYLLCADEGRARRIAAGVATGSLYVNTPIVRDLDTPFGGMKNSGIGRDGGIWSVDFFTDIKNVAYGLIKVTVT